MATVEMDTELLIKEIREILRYNNNYKITIDLFGLYGTICVEIEKVSLPYNEKIFMDRGENFNKRLINIYEFLIHNVPNLCFIQKNE